MPACFRLLHGRSGSVRPWAQSDLFPPLRPPEQWIWPRVPSQFSKYACEKTPFKQKQLCLSLCPAGRETTPLPSNHLTGLGLIGFRKRCRGRGRLSRLFLLHLIQFVIYLI